MLISAFDWDEKNITHIARHNVTPEEVEEMFESRPLIFKSRDESCVALGQSDVGRYLMVAYRYCEAEAIRVITARDMSDSERRLFRRKKG
ncbi:BrnT family toxin [Candidatus Saganbacteria bacterium]|nr:BrnT family toxin [Candidatus Saganbacteria bacterium]